MKVNAYGSFFDHISGMEVTLALTPNPDLPLILAKWEDYIQAEMGERALVLYYEVLPQPRPPTPSPSHLLPSTLTGLGGTES